jgi:fructokinase
MAERPARTRPLVYGEVLFDHFPGGSRILGGAPFNVAWHLRGFGEQPLFIGRVGNDEMGHEVRLAMQDWDMDLAGLQTDLAHPTGRVNIEVVDGEPRYAMVADQAYDFISAPELPDLAEAAWLYHGSLALRQPTSRESLDTLISRLDIPVIFDVNLRPPWWRKPRIRQWLSRADWVKLNQEEWSLLTPASQPIESATREFIDSHALSGLLLTHGKDGAEAWTAEGRRYRVRPASAGQVTDTVGAGDAFTAVFLLGQLRGWDLARTLQRAQGFASAIVGVRGATVSDRAFYRGFLDDWASSG